MGKKEDLGKLAKRLTQLEAEIEICTKTNKEVLAQLSSDEKELLGAINAIQQKLIGVITRKSVITTEYAEIHSRLMKEYRAIETHLLSSGDKDLKEKHRHDYSDLKQLLSDESLRTASKNISLSRGCWTCTECVTNCVECISSCTQCVTNTCLTSTTPECTPWDSMAYANCSPKPDVGNKKSTRTSLNPDFGALTVDWDESGPEEMEKPVATKKVGGTKSKTNPKKKA